MANKKLRLDMALVERGFFQSRNRAQASIMAGEILVNGQADTRADRTILPEDVISIKEKHKSAQRYKDILEVTGGRTVPSWLEADHENLTGTVKEVPSRDVIDVPVNATLIVELYSK